MHLHSHLTKTTTVVARGADSASSSNASSAMTVDWIKNGMSTILEKFKSNFISPISMFVLQATKQKMLSKRGYVDNRSADIVDLCICLASLVGTMTIIIPYCINRRSRKLRHSLILGLATSDLVSSLIIIATTSYSIAGNDLATASKFCTFAGFIFSSSIWTQHQWNLSIAGITYMILVHPLSSFVSNVERHLIWLWPIFWSIAFIANGIAWRYVGFSDVDGYCTYNPTRGGSYFSAIFAFVPRACVSIFILVLYTHLFFFLRRTNLFSKVNSSSNNHSPRRSANSNGISFGGGSKRLGHQSNQGLESIVTDSNHKFGSSMGRTANTVFAQVKRTCSFSAPPTPRTSSIAVTETTDSSKRNGSNSTQGKSSTTPLLPIPIEDGRIDKINGVDEFAGISPKTKAWNSEELGFDQDTKQQEQEDKMKVNINQQQSSQPPILQRPSTAAEGSPSRLKAPLSISRRPMTAPNSQADRESGSEIDLESLNESNHGTNRRKNDLGIYDALTNMGKEVDENELFKPMTVRRDNRDFGMTSPPQEHLRHVSLSPAGVKLAKKALADSVVNDEEYQKNSNNNNNLIIDELAVLPTTSSINNESSSSEKEVQKGDAIGSLTYEDLLKPDWQWGMLVNQSEQKQSRHARHSSINNNDHHHHQGSRRRSSRWQIWPSVSERGQGTNSFGSSNDENGVEAIGSTLNRQASVLMLLYPAAYVLLFSISIVRILVDIGNTVSGNMDPMANSNPLHAIARWSIFIQGAIDAIVFMLIERQFRLRMRRKRRIAAGEKVEDVWLIRMLKKAKENEKCQKKEKEENKRVEKV